MVDYLIWFQFFPCAEKTVTSEGESSRSNGVICQAGLFGSVPHPADYSDLTPDSHCLTELPLDKALIEYRYHLEHNLDTREVSCEIGISGTHVDYRRGRSSIQDA